MIDEQTLTALVEVDATPAYRARFLASVECVECGGSVMQTCVGRFGGRLPRVPCFEAAIG